jgi:succinate-acetate transporter protein
MIAEWIMGNFFSMMVMGMFAVFWLSFGVLQTPSWGIAASYSATGNAAEGAATKGYNAAVALYLLVWGFWLFTTWIFTLKTNTVFALIFFFAFVSNFIFSAAYWKVSTGDYAMAMKLQHVRNTSLNSVSEISELIAVGWRRNILRSRTPRILYYCCHDGG